MPDFSVCWYENPSARNVVGLSFDSKTREPLIIKDVVFLSDKGTMSRNCETEIHVVFSGDDKVIRYFKYPDFSVTYKSVKFRIHQEGQKGWCVTVDLNTGAVDIQESSLQIM